MVQCCSFPHYVVMTVVMKVVRLTGVVAGFSGEEFDSDAYRTFVFNFTFVSRRVKKTS